LIVDFSVSAHAHHRPLHSFPTRRSSDLALYTDPVRINGTDVRIAQLVRRARTMSAALEARTTELISQVTAGDRTVVAFRMHGRQDRKSTRLNSSHLVISYAVFCLKKKTK